MILDSPYKGLVPFEDTELDALLFFGRERESEIIGANVLAARLTVLYGPSGVGKTSVLAPASLTGCAGRRGRTSSERGHPEFVVVVFDAWSDDPVAVCGSGARGAEWPLRVGAARRAGGRIACRHARALDGRACVRPPARSRPGRGVLPLPRRGDRLCRELPELVTRPGLRVRVLLALRDDALAKLDRFKGRIPNLFANYLRLDHLDRRSASEAIRSPSSGTTSSRQSIEVEAALSGPCSSRRPPARSISVTQGAVSPPARRTRAGSRRRTSSS